MDNVGLRYALKKWACGDVNDKASLIITGEVGLSTAILNDGFNIASTATYHNWDFRDPNLQHCGLVTEKPGKEQNPTACYHKGCRSLDPCELIFVKYGGDLHKAQLISTYTQERIELEDSKWIDDTTYSQSSCDNTYGFIRTDFQKHS